MAKENTYFFSHDYNAHNDVKILFMRQQLGMEGYGIYWFLIENLANSGGFLPLKIVPVLAMQMQTNEVKVLAVIREFELFEVTDDEFFSIRLNKHLDMMKSFSENGKKGAEVRWKNRGANAGAIEGANANKSKVNKKKEDKKKEDKSKEIPLTQNLTFTGIYPKNTDFTELPGQYIESVKMQTFQTKKITLESSTIIDLWEAFKLQNLDGVKLYQNENDVYKHFVNWFKSQKFENNGTKSKSRAERHSEGLHYLLNLGKTELAKVMAINQQNKTD